MPNPEAHIADIRLACRRLATPGIFTSLEDIRRELADNVYPAMEALALEVKDTIEEVDEIADAQGSFIDDELGQRIFGALAAGATLAEDVRKVVASLDDMTRTRLLAECDAFSHASEVASLGITEAMGYDDGDEEDGEIAEGADDTNEAE